LEKGKDPNNTNNIVTKITKNSSWHIVWVINSPNNQCKLVFPKYAIYQNKFIGECWASIRQRDETFIAIIKQSNNLQVSSRLTKADRYQTGKEGVWSKGEKISNICKITLWKIMFIYWKICWYIPFFFFLFYTHTYIYIYIYIYICVCVCVCV